MNDEPESPKITPPKVFPDQIAGTFDHGRTNFPLVVKQVPEPRTTLAGQRPTVEPPSSPS